MCVVAITFSAQREKLALLTSSRVGRLGTRLPVAGSERAHVGGGRDGTCAADQGYAVH